VKLVTAGSSAVVALATSFYSYGVMKLAGIAYAVYYGDSGRLKVQERYYDI
jgi:hypothetical protein